MAFKLSKRSDIESFRVLDNLRAVNERIAKGENIIRLEAGQPCFGAPQQALDYARDRIARDPKQGYTDAIGMIPLRQRVATYYKEAYNCNVDFQRVALTTGSSGGFIFAFLAAFDAGDTVAVTVPSYPPYRNMLRSLGINVGEIPTSPDTHYQPPAELLEKCGKKFSGLLINSPANPTGAMIDEKELKKICEWCDANGVRLVSDEAYHGITYETPAMTALKYSKTAIVLNTFSKYFAMTGWRLGWMVSPDIAMADRVKRLAENFCVSPPTISQHVAMKTFEHRDVLDGYVKQYRENRDILREGFPKAGITNLSQGAGAFYLYADVHTLSNDSEEFCRRMLNEAKVSATTGIDFDSERGRASIRISYAGEPDEMREACVRLKTWLAKAA